MQSLRIRAFLADRAVALLVVLAVVTLLGGWLTVGAHVAPGTVSEERTASSWATTGDWAHSATVTEPKSVFPAGTEQANRSLYFTRVTPVLDGTFTYSYRASDDGALDVTVRQRTVLRSVAADDDATAVLWREVLDRQTRRASGLAPRESVSVPFSVDVNRTLSRADRIRDDLGDASGRTQLRVVAEVTVAGTVNGRPVNRTTDRVLLIAPDESVYEVNATNETRTFETTETVGVRREPGPLEAVGGPLLFGFGFAGLAAFATVRARNGLDVTDAERERLAFERDRSEFDEWIHRIDLPDADLSRARTESLADLVDLAIDTGNGVVEVPGEETFHVVHDGCLYTYEAPPAVDDAEGPDDESSDD